MPRVNVDRVLRSPLVAAQSFSVIRREEVVGNNGIPALTATNVPGLSGAVSPSDNDLVREEAYQTQQSAIQVVTRYRLRGAGVSGDGKTWSPDIVVWKGGQYLVRVAQDYTQFGAGFVRADCVGFDPQQGVPT